MLIFVLLVEICVLFDVLFVFLILILLVEICVLFDVLFGPYSAGAGMSCLAVSP
jgi:hypothetical protein